MCKTQIRCPVWGQDFFAGFIIEENGQKKVIWNMNMLKDVDSTNLYLVFHTNPLLFCSTMKIQLSSWNGKTPPV